MSDYSVTLSTTEPNNYVGLIKLRQGDVASQSIQATITANGQLFNFDHLAVFFNAVLPNGNVVRDKVTEVDYVNSKLNYIVADSFLQEVAQVTAWFSFENGEKIIDSTKNFQYSVIPGWKECIPQGNYIYELSEIQREIEEIISNKDFTTLLSELDFLKTNIAYLDNNIKTIKADLNNSINDKLSQISSVPETFANLAALKSTYPNGKTGLFVTADTGHKFIWANGSWSDAGIYQSVGIADGTVTNDLLAPSARYGSIICINPAEIDSVNKTLTLSNLVSIMSGTQIIYAKNNNVVIQLDPDKTNITGFWISFDPADGSFKSNASPTEISKDNVYLGWISIAGGVTYDLHIPSVEVEVDGVNPASLPFDKKVVVASQNPFDLNLKNRILTPPAIGYLNIFTSKQLYTLSTRDPINLGSGASFVYYVISTGSMTTTSAVVNVSQSPDLIFLGWISWDSPTPNYDFIFNYTVDGAIPGQGLSFGFANKVGTTFGDSITQGVQLNGATNWTTMLGEKLHLSKITNAGISGTTYSKDASRTDSAVERAASINGQDLITVWFGINDYHYGRPLGTFGNGDVTTVFGAADYVYKTLITNNPTATIVVITPMKQHGYSTFPDSFTKKGAGLLQIDYVNAIKQVADYYSLPVLDFYEMSGMSPFVDVQRTQYFFDGLHPNAAGQYRVAQKIARFVEING